MREKLGIGNQILKNPNWKIRFFYYLQITDDVYKNLEDCNPTKKKMLVFDDAIVDMKADTF